ncbi:hypothetical protein [Romboutsia sp.]|uniref:hypothetical protein n=1 Tax=Romboutsia sp. TaxID=1965302 RepID=UPI003F378DC9
MDFSIDLQVLPEVLEDSIPRLIEGMEEKENLFRLLKIESTENDEKSRWILAGKSEEGKNVWAEKQNIDNTLPLEKKRLVNFIRYLDGDIEELIAKYPRTASELVEQYCKEKYIVKNNNLDKREILRKHFHRDVAPIVLTEIVRDVQEARDLVIDRHYKEKLSESYEVKIKKAPWREEYIREEDALEIREIIERIAFKWTYKSSDKIKNKAKWNYNMKTALSKNGFRIKKVLNLKGFPIYDYDSIKKDSEDIDYPSLYKEELRYKRAIDLKKATNYDDSHIYFSDENVSLYMKEYHPEIFFKHEHEKIFY